MQYRRRKGAAAVEQSTAQYSTIQYSIGRKPKDGTDIENENEEEMMVEEDGNWRGFDGNDQGTDKV